MDRLTSLRVFREVVEAGSFAAAAGPPGDLGADGEQARGAARAIAGRAAAAPLEPAPEPDRGRPRLVRAERARARPARRGRGRDRPPNEAPRGQLKVSAPVWCATPRIARVLADYRERFPEVLVDMHLENRKVDLAADGYDLALRATQEPSPALIARPLTRLQFHLVAAPDYLARAGRPATPAELAKLACHRPQLREHRGPDAQGAGRAAGAAAAAAGDEVGRHHAHAACGAGGHGHGLPARVAGGRGPGARGGWCGWCRSTRRRR